MSWHFSLALVAEFSAASCSGGAPSAPSRSTPTPEAYYWPDKTTGHSRLSRFGMTSEPLTGALGEELLTWFLAASRARTSAQPEKAQESTASDPACGAKWRELSARYDRDTCSWKTHRSLWDEDLSACSLTLPRWGSMRDGVLSELMTLEHRISANDAGLWPTPLASNTKAHHMRSGGRPARSYWPTPTAILGTKGGRVTPRKSLEGGTLIEAVSARKTWPTPTVNDSKNCTLPSSQVKHDNIPGALLRDGKKAGEALNPTWVEWLMNWPLKWTALAPMKHENWEFWKESSAAYFQSNGLREMWFDRDPSTPPQGQESGEQHNGKRGDSVPEMPQGRTHAGRNVGSRESGTIDLQGVREIVPAEAHAPIIDLRFGMTSGMGPNQCREAMEYVPKVSIGVIARVDRLRSIGNGQVPRVAEAAWRMLT